jgi:hypothetical protein
VALAPASGGGVAVWLLEPGQAAAGQRVAANGAADAVHPGGTGGGTQAAGHRCEEGQVLGAPELASPALLSCVCVLQCIHAATCSCCAAAAYRRFCDLPSSPPIALQRATLWRQ